MVSSGYLDGIGITPLYISLERSSVARASLVVDAKKKLMNNELRPILFIDFYVFLGQFPSQTC